MERQSKGIKKQGSEGQEEEWKRKAGKREELTGEDSEAVKENNKEAEEGEGIVGKKGKLSNRENEKERRLTRKSKERGKGGQGE